MFFLKKTFRNVFKSINIANKYSKYFLFEIDAIVFFYVYRPSNSRSFNKENVSSVRNRTCTTLLGVIHKV